MSSLVSKVRVARAEKVRVTHEELIVDLVDGRTGTVIACTLRALGLPVADVLDYMKRLNAARGKQPGWPESPWQMQQVKQWPAS